MENNSQSLEDIVEQATLDYALGEEKQAVAALRKALEENPGAFAIHHALAEIYFSMNELDFALHHAETAAGIDPGDVHIHTSLSRIWMERGDKDKAEAHGAKARMLGWKSQLKEPPPAGPDNPLDKR